MDKFRILEFLKSLENDNGSIPESIWKERNELIRLIEKDLDIIKQYQKTLDFKESFLNMFFDFMNKDLDNLKTANETYDSLKFLIGGRVIVGQGYLFSNIKEFDSFQEICIDRVSEINKKISYFKKNM